MKIRTKYLIFISLSIVASLGVFLVIALNAYSKDKTAFIKDKASQEVLFLAGQISELLKSNGNSILMEDVIQKLFVRDDVADKYLIDKNGIVQAGEESLRGKSFAEGVSLNALSKVNMNPFATGLVEGLDNKGHEIFVAYAGVPESGLLTLQVYKISQLNRFLVLFIIKTLFSFAAIGSFFLLAGFFVISRLSKGLEVLSASVETFGAGEYEHRVHIDSQDEVGVLGRQVNVMAEKIQKSMKLEAEKIRMEMEMETARKVQETLFLPNLYSNGEVDIAGFYEPASECSGDWWYYFDKGGSTWICIGDVTGHGVGAAMLTSSVRAAFSFFQQQENLRPRDILKELNRVIWESVGGKFNMTFLVIEIDRKNKKIRYANASHEFPILVPKNVDIKRKDIRFLMDGQGPRMGQASDSNYSDHEIDMPYDGRIICYSDGLYDVENPLGEAFGDSRLIRLVLKTNINSKKIDIFNKKIIQEIYNHRMQSALVDDVSLVCVDLNISKPEAA